MAYDQLGLIAERAGSKLPGSSPNNLYRSADGCFIHVAALADPIFRRLSAAMGSPELADEARFATNRQRSLDGEDVDALVQHWIGSLPFETVHQRLTEYDIPHTKIYNIDDVFRDPHFSAREAIARLPQPKLDLVTVPNVTPRLSATPGHLNAPGRETGADTAEVLERLLDHRNTSGARRDHPPVARRACVARSRTPRKSKCRGQDRQCRRPSDGMPRRARSRARLTLR